jgi:hypothetical protein
VETIIKKRGITIMLAAGRSAIAQPAILAEHREAT